ncbi:MAG: hypothetical protein GX299_06765 [Epulopiscium sp.]|jgi:hypothetical protein|nr:hypothetical protein [Candidatus Epulonipiscium sp.]
MKKVILILISCYLLCGCSTKGIQNNLSQIRIARAQEITSERSNAERAKIIKENILTLEELKGAAVVVEGNTALIGLRIKQEWLEDGMRIKKEAGNLAKEADEAIQSTSVTVSESITKMIEQMEHKRNS